MNWRLWQFLAHIALGLVAMFAILSLKSLLGPGSHQCCILLLIPAAGFAVSWWLPGGAPGASLAAAAWFMIRFPSDAGPTAKSLATGFAVFLGGGMLVCELLGAAIRSAQLRKSAGETNQETQP